MAWATEPSWAWKWEKRVLSLNGRLEHKDKQPLISSRSMMLIKMESMICKSFLLIYFFSVFYVFLNRIVCRDVGTVQVLRLDENDQF
jgi:hypothetical protein